MTAHAIHEPIQINGLADGCDRCAQIAKDPFTHLDPHTLAAYWRRMVRVEYDQPTELPKSSTDAICLHALYRMAIFIDRYVEGVNVWAWPIRRRLSVAREALPPWRERAFELEAERDRLRDLAQALEEELNHKRGTFGEFAEMIEASLSGEPVQFSREETGR